MEDIIEVKSETEETNPNVVESDFSYPNNQKPNPKYKPQGDIQISVGDPTINNASIRKYALYPITGNDSSGNFQINRRYKDFRALRDVLSKQWQGCYIPQIPPKQMIGNLQADFLDQRKKLLEFFLIKTAKIPYIYQSEIFQQFIRGPQDFLKCVGHIGRLPYTKQVNIYKEIFSDSANFIGNEESNREMKEIQKELANCLTNLQMLEGKCKMTVDYFGFYQKEIQGMFGDLKNVNKLYLDDIEINCETRKLEKNPYIGILDWVRTEILDLSGLVDAIQDKFNLEAAQLKTAEKIDKERQHLLKLQIGKRNFFQIICQSPKEHYIEKSNRDIAKFEEELQCIEKITNIVAGNLLNKTIPKFKEGKQQIYDAMVRGFTSASIKELEFLVMQNKQVEQCFN
ncbi:unnamed protein product [Blepharisma stoltei]|uniref:PX domain-containing protein n=1 Tax=Blepharisma stoltei TaxID=1481888 RepID=A0AAU9KPX9_9CILI|nr:unnamed protein product [Blepharisma stoltei]